MYMDKRVEIKKLTNKEVVLEIEGEDHTIGNLIARLAQQIEGVKFAAYRIPHPLIPKLIVTIITDGVKDPINVLREVLNNIVSMSRDFRAQLLEELRKHEERV